MTTADSTCSPRPSLLAPGFSRWGFLAPLLLIFALICSTTARGADREPRRQTAARTAILNANEIVVREAHSLPAADDHVPIALSRAEIRLVMACDAYAERFPAAVDVHKVEYRAGFIFFSHNQLAEAISRFKHIVDHHTTTIHAEQAANLILDALELQGDLSGVRETSFDYYQRPLLGGPPFKAEAWAHYERASRQLANPTAN